MNDKYYDTDEIYKLDKINVILSNMGFGKIYKLIKENKNEMSMKL